jgi:hypothetical protein
MEINHWTIGSQSLGEHTFWGFVDPLDMSKTMNTSTLISRVRLIRASDVVCKGILLLQLGEILGKKGPLQIHNDNKVALNITESKGFTRRVKHLEIHDACICIFRERGIVTILQVQLDDNHADILMKAFQSPAAFMNAEDNLFSPLSSKPAGECCGITSLPFY